MNMLDPSIRVETELLRSIYSSALFSSLYIKVSMYLPAQEQNTGKERDGEVSLQHPS